MRLNAILAASAAAELFLSVCVFAAPPKKKEPPPPPPLNAMDQALLAACREPRPDPDRLLAAAKTPWELPFDERGQFVPYAVCKGLASKTAACGALPSSGKAGVKLRYDCDEMSFISREIALALGPKNPGERQRLDAECRRMLSAQLPPEEIAAACHVEFSGTSPQEVCARFPSGHDKEFDAQCVENYLFLRRSVDECARARDDFARSRCRELVLLIAGLQDPSACGKSGLCRAVKGEGASACAGYGEAFVRGVCGRVAKADEDFRREAAREAQKKAEVQARAEADKKKLLEQALSAQEAKKKAEEAAERERQIAAKKKSAEAEAKAAQEREKAAQAEAARAKLAEEQKARAALGELERAEKAKKKAVGADKPQFKKGEAMEKDPVDVQKIMRELERRGQNPPPGTPAEPQKGVQR